MRFHLTMPVLCSVSIFFAEEGSSDEEEGETDTRLKMVLLVRTDLKMQKGGTTSMTSLSLLIMFSSVTQESRWHSVRTLV